MLFLPGSVWTTRGWFARSSPPRRRDRRDPVKAGRDAGLSDRPVAFLKAATTVISTSDTALAPHSLAAAFLASLIGTGVFETMLGRMMQLPLRTTISSVTAALTGATIAENNVKPASRLWVGASDLDATKAVALVAVTSELL